MDPVSEVVTVAASCDTTTTIQESTNTFNVNQSNNNTHTQRNNLTNKITSNVISSSNNSNLCIGSSSHSNSSNSSCSSSSTSSTSSGYGSSTTTPTNNYDLQQRTPTTTPIPTTAVATAEHIIPVATVAAVTPFYNESIATHNSETHYVQHHHHHSQQQQQQQHQQQHHLLQTNHHQYSQNHLQQQPHQYLPRQQYYSPYDYQQTTSTHNLSGSTATPAVAPYNMIIPGPYEMSSSVVAPTYGAGQYKPSSSTGATTNYERSSVVKTNVAASAYNQQQQQQQGEQQNLKTINQQTQHLTGFLGSSKQRSSSLISNSMNTNTSKPQAAATPFYANPTPFYDNFRNKMPLEYHDTYSNPPANTATSYHQQQKFYAAAKSQLKETSYGSAASLNSKSLYGNTGNFFPGPTAGLNLSSATYDKYMYSHTSPAGYSATGHLGNETPPDVSNYRKPLVGNTMNSSSWPWGIDYASGNSRSLPPPPSHLPTATVAPTHATHLTQNSSVLARDAYYMGHDKYGAKYDKYTAPSYQQSYVSPPTNRHIWPNTAHASNLTSLNERHILATGPPPLTSHGLHTSSYFPNSSTTSLNSRQSCCSQPHQPQNCYYPVSHAVQSRLAHTQNPTVASPTGGYLTAQQTLGQSPHLNALNASCKYGGVLPDYGNGNKFKNSNDLYLNTHHYENNPALHNFGYGSAHSNQLSYNTNAHQSMNHGSTPSSLLTNDPLSANPTSYTIDLNLTTSNFDNYHSHLDTHASQQQLPPEYEVAVAKRALLDYRKPIQPQPPPTIAEDCYTTLTARDHYNQQELLNTPETTTIFGEYEANQSNAANLATQVLADTDRGRDESSKNLSLRDFIANWNDDEDEFQNNEEMTFDQDTVIDEVLQIAPVEHEPNASVIIEEVKLIKPALENAKDNEIPEQSVNTVEELAATLNEAEANQYVNLPDIVVDIKKSNNVNNSITTPTSSLTVPLPLQEADTNILNLTNFDVEKELDELNLKKPAQQEVTKDLNDIKDITKTDSTSQLSPSKNLSFEDLNLEPANKTVLNAITARLTTNHSSYLNEQYFKDIEGYESSSSRHSNESAFEKEYETFINKITGETCVNKSVKETTATETDAEKEIDFEKNFQDFSKFYKRKRKLKEVEPKSTAIAMQSKKKLKTTETIKINNSNFPQAYTKKSRNKLNKIKLHSQHKRKPRSAFYKIIHSLRRCGLFRVKRVREYMTEVKEKHLPLIKRQSIKNYSHDIPESLFNAKSLKALCIVAINTQEFRDSLMLTLAETDNNCLESEQKHICTDPSCETCEVIKSLMEADTFETTLMQQATDTNENASFAAAILCSEGDNGTITIVEATPNTDDLNYGNKDSIVISSEIANFQYSKENLTTFNTKDLVKDVLLNSTEVIKIVAHDNVALEKYNDSSVLELIAKDHAEIALQPASETAISTESFFTQIDKFKCKSVDLDFPSGRLAETLEGKTSETNNIEIGNFTLDEMAELNKFDHLPAIQSTPPNILFSDQHSDMSAGKKFESSKNLGSISSELTEVVNISSLSETVSAKENFCVAKQVEESDSGNTDSSESDTDSSSSDSENKSNSSSESSDTDTETDSDNDDETANSDLHQSTSHWKNTTSNKVSGSREKNEMQERASFFKNDNKRQKPNPSPRSGKTVSEDLNQTDIDSEEENHPNSPQRIVIRITKSLSPNDQSLRVENVSGMPSKLPAEVDNQIESEIRDEKSKELSSTTKFSLKQDNYVSEKSVETGSENDNTENKSVIVSAPLKLILRRQDFSKKLALEESELYNSFESESEDESVTQKKLKINETTLCLQRKCNGVREDPFYKPRTEREFKDAEISDVITISGKFSPKKEAEVSERCNKNKESGCEMISKNVTSTAKEQEIVKGPVFEKTSGALAEVNDFEDVSGLTSEMSSTCSKSNLKRKDFFEYVAAKKSGEICSAEIIPTLLKSRPKQATIKEVEAFEKYVQSNANESEEVEIKSEIILTTLRLKPIQETVNQVPTSPIECESNTENQMGSNHLELKTNEVTKSLDLSRLPKNSIDKHNSKNSPLLSNELKYNKENKTEEEEKVCQTSKLSPREDHQTERESECDAAEEIQKKKSDDPTDDHQSENESERNDPGEFKKSRTYDTKGGIQTESESECDGPEEIQKKKSDDPIDDHQSGSESECDAAEEIKEQKTYDTKDGLQTEYESESDDSEEIKKKKIYNPNDDHESGSVSESDGTEEIEKNKTYNTKYYRQPENESERNDPGELKKSGTYDTKGGIQTESESECDGPEEIQKKKTDDPTDDHQSESASESDDSQEIEKKKYYYPKDNHQSGSEFESDRTEEIENNTTCDTKNDQHTESGSDYDASKKVERKKSNSISASFTAKQNQNNNKKEKLSKKSALAIIKIYNLTSSESEEEEEEESDIEMHSLVGGEDIILSSSQSSSNDSEYESDDSDKILNNSNTIVISDDDSIDSFVSNEQLETTVKPLKETSAHAVQQIKSTSNFINSNESQEPLIANETEFSNKKHRDVIIKVADYSNNSINVQEASDLKVLQKLEDEKDSVTLNNGSLEEYDFKDANMNSKGKYFSEHSSSEEDFYEETCDRISDHKTPEREELHLTDQSYTHLKENDNDESEDNEDISVEYHKSPEIHEDMIEVDTPIENQSIPDTSYCATDIEQPISETFSNVENYVAQKPEITIIKGHNTIQIESDMLFKNVEQMETETSQSSSEDINKNIKPLSEVKPINTRKLLQTNYITDPKLSSSSFLRASPEIAEESLGDNSDRSIKKDIIPEAGKTSTSEASISKSEQKQSMPQDIIEESIKNDEVPMAERNTSTLTEPIPVKLLAEPEITDYTNANSNKKGETEIRENNTDQIMMEDKATKPEEKIIFQDPKRPPAETCRAITKKKLLQIDIQEQVVSNKKYLNMPEEKILDTKETIAQTATKGRDTSSERETNSRLINKPTTLHDHCMNKSAIKEHKSISKSRIEEAKIYDDAKYLQKPIVMPITESTSQKSIESSNISIHVNDEHVKVLNEKIAVIDQTISELVSEIRTENSDFTKKIHNKKIFEEKSNENEINAENITKESENTLEGQIKKSCSHSRTDDTNKILDIITKTAAKKAESLAQFKIEEPKILENQKITNSENTSDHQSHLEENTINKSNSKTRSEEAIESEQNIVEDNFSGNKTEKTVTVNEILQATRATNNQILKQEFELTSEVGSISKAGKKGDELIEEKKFITKNIFTTDVMDTDDYDSISQENLNQNSDEVAKVSNQIESPANSSGAICEKSNSNEEKCVNELKTKNSTNLKEVKSSDDSAESIVDHKDPSNTEISKNFEENIKTANQTNLKDDKLQCVKPEANNKSKAEHQTEHSNLTCAEISRQHVATKDSSTSDDMSTDFFGFKNQSSFEDESEDFHGFEDLEEVTRIRQEMETLNDDSAANDGFLNNPILNRQIYKSSTASLNESTSSEINELEALEKELSQHQPEVEDEDKETEKDLPIKPIEIASSNDIKHIKQMLESDEEQQTDKEEKKEKLAHICKDKSIENNNKNNSKDILSFVNSIIPKLSDLCRAALNSSLNSNSNLTRQHTETSANLVERELSVEEALAEMYRQAGVLLSDPEDCDNDIPSPGHNETHDVLLINLQEMLNSDNNDVYVLQCDMNENVLNVVQSTDEEQPDNDIVNAERVNTVQIILDTENPEPQIHIISSDSESEVIILSDDDSEFSYRPFLAPQERATIPFINDDNIDDSDSVFDISTIHHEEIVPDNLNKFLQEEFYKYLHEKYVQRSISKYYHANRILKKYKRRYIRTNRE